MLLVTLLPMTEPMWIRLLRRAPLPDRWIVRLNGVLTNALQGLRTFHNISRFSQFFAMTALIWCLDASTAVICAYAIHVSLQPAIAFLLLASLGLASALPSTPGYIGLFQFVAVAVLVPFGMSRADAVTFILLFQAANYVVVAIWASIGLGRLRAAHPRPAF